MKNPLLTICSVIGVLCLLTYASFAAGSKPSQDPDGAHEEHGLEADMEEMSDHLRALRKSLKDPQQNPASLLTIVGMQEAVGRAKQQAPPIASNLPEDKRPAFLQEYRLEMIKVAQKLLDLEALVLQSKMEEALVTYKELRGMEEPGHERFAGDE
ncbi:MAG: hypothetical protein ACI8X5_000996 [Planctomycetota bacterium]|jgi:hypothetical protein